LKSNNVWKCLKTSQCCELFVFSGPELSEEEIATILPEIVKL